MNYVSLKTFVTALLLEFCTFVIALFHVSYIVKAKAYVKSLKYKIKGSFCAGVNLYLVFTYVPKLSSRPYIVNF